MNWGPIDINIKRSSPSDSLDQLVKHGASNAKVQGSNPGWSVIFSLTDIYVVWWHSLKIISQNNDLAVLYQTADKKISFNTFFLMLYQLDQLTYIHQKMTK